MNFRFLFLILIALPISGILIFNFWHENSYSGVIYYAKKQKIYNPSFDVYWGEIEPDFPNEVSNSQDIKGIDSNRNNIRDDIDVWINRASGDKELHLAIVNYALFLQESIIKCNPLNKYEKIKQTELENNLKNLNWLQKKDPYYFSDKLKILTLNTLDRKSALSN